MRGRRRRRPRAARPTVALALVAVVLTGCGEAASVGCRTPAEDLRQVPRLSIAAAKERQGEFVSVSGSLIAVDGRPDRLCTGIVTTDPPQCSEPSLEVEGVRDLTNFEVPVVEDGVVGPTAYVGRIDGDTLRFEVDCRTQQVLQHVGDATGEEPTHVPLGSGSNYGSERLDWNGPDGAPAELTERYGTFSIVVELDEEDEPVMRDTLEGVKNVRGVYWLSDEGYWYAVKRYADDVAVIWNADVRRLDERWERLDAVMRELPPETG